MDIRNKEEYDISNIPQWLDYFKDLDIPIKFIDLEEPEHQNYHGRKCRELMLDGLTYVEEVILPYSKWTCLNIEKVVDDAIKYGVHVIGHSIDISMADEQAYKKALQKARDNNTFVVQSAGNDSINLDTSKKMSKMDNSFTISSIHFDKRPKISSYTNKGEALDYCDFGLMYLNDEQLIGTSFARPMFEKKIILVLKLFISQGIPIVYEYVENFINSHLLDLGEVGDDKYFGKGLFVLPDITKIKLEETNTMIFKDVDQTKYYADEIKQITDLGIMAGDDEGNFRPEEPIKRGDLTIVISNLLKHLNEKK